MSEGESGRRRGQRGERQTVQGLAGHRKDSGFYPSEVGPLEGRKQSRDMPRHGCSRAPPGGCGEEQTVGWKVQARGPRREGD